MNLHLSRQLRYFSAARRVFVFVVSIPSSTAGVTLPTFRPYRRAMVFCTHYYGFHRVLFPSLCALGGNIGASPAVFVFVRHEFFPCCCHRSCILAYLFFQGLRCALASASDAFKLLLTRGGSTLSTIGVPLIAPVGPTSRTEFHAVDHWRPIDSPHRSQVAY